MVVGDQHAAAGPRQARLRAAAARRSTRVPPSGRGSTEQLPPSSAARSRIEDSPTPGAGSAGKPAPSSVTSTVRRRRRPRAGPRRRAPRRGGRRWSAPPARSGRRRPRPRPAAAAARRATSTATADAAAVGGRSARRSRWSAPTRPSSSSAGGRRPWTRRRMSAIAVRSSRAQLGRPARRRAAGSRGDEPAQHPGLHASGPASWAPSPSCRSRRSRRRSSSRAVTSRSRERCRSAVSRTAWTATPACRARSSSSRRSAGPNGSPGRAAEQSSPTGSVLVAAAAGRTVPADRLPGARPPVRRRPSAMRGVGQPQRLAHGRDDRRQDRLRRERALQPLAEPGERGVGLVALAVEQPVDPPLQPVAQRLERTATMPVATSEISRSPSRRSAAPR